MDINDFKVTDSETVFEGRIIDVVRDTISLPDGKTAYREVIAHGGASAIVPVDPEGNIIFVRQYRHPAKAMVLEIPAGTLEQGEDPEVCAIRELEEETGFKAGKVTFLTKFYSSIGFCTEVLHIYLAEDLTQGSQNLDEDEFVTIEKYSLEQAVEMALNGGIVDSKTIASILLYKEVLNRRK